MFLELMLYLLIGIIVVSLVFKIVYALVTSLREGFGNEGMQSLSDVQKIIGDITCPKDFLCATVDRGSFVTTDKSGLTSLFVCLETRINACTFVDAGGEHHLCKCPIRSYLHRELKQ